MNRIWSEITAKDFRNPRKSIMVAHYVAASRMPTARVINNDARRAGSVLVARIHKCACCFKPKNEDPCPQNTGTLSTPGKSIFTLLRRTRPPRPFRANKVFQLPSTEKTGRYQREKLGGSPKTTADQQTDSRTLSTQSGQGTLPHDTEMVERPHVTFLPTKREFVTAPRGLSGFHIRSKIIPVRARHTLHGCRSLSCATIVEP